MSTVFAEPYASLAPDALVVLTVGHSTRAWEDFLRLLRAYGVTYLVDVRTVPRSRHNPQFNCETLRQELEGNGIGYEHLPALGGLRKPRADSPNTGWRNASFRGYADHMRTPEFKAGLHRLVDLAGPERVVIMCAEAVPWRCHRSLIGDALLVQGIRVEDIMSEKRVAPHKLTPWAHVSGDDLTYPPETENESRPPTPQGVGGTQGDRALATSSPGEGQDRRSSG